MSHAMMTPQVFAIRVVVMMRRRWTVMIWNILRMLYDFLIFRRLI
jgi:hypothetical protein